MVNFLKYFDKVYCINLDRRPDRWDNVKLEFDKWGINNVERYSAIDGKTIENESHLLDGEIGILQTHYDIIKKCKEEKLNNVLIMEDDVYFTEEILKFDEYMGHVPNDWDMIYVGGNHTYGHPPEKVNDKIIRLNNTVAIHCVAIKNTIFEPLISMAPRRKKQIDGYYAQVQKSFNCYGFTPNVAMQIQGFSDIQNRVVNYDTFFR